MATDGDDQDQAGCDEHMWLYRAVGFRPDGSWSEYVCELCGRLLLVPPGGNHPETV